MRDRVEDRRFKRLKLLEPVPGLLLLGDVHRVAQHGPSSAVVDRCHRFQNPFRPAVAGDDPELVGRKALPLQHPNRIFPSRHPVYGMDQTQRIHPEHLLFGITGIFLNVRVGELEFAVLEDVNPRLGAVCQGPVKVFVKGMRLAHR